MNETAIYHSKLDIPRSPTSASTSSGRDSQNPFQPSLLNYNPNFPSTRSSRKRAASLSTDEANQAQTRLGDLALNSARTVGQLADPLREQVCLCQPDPKIPRPRNAFILYRQHYQGQIVARNPGLSNPDISKIIGEQWKEQPAAVKENWKRLAEEEKVRHSRQYPGYRYQPRRGGKAGGVRQSSSSPTDDSGRCPKCGGRYISDPATPQTPFTPAFADSASRSDRVQSYSSAMSSGSAEGDSARRNSQVQSNTMESPRTMAPQHLHRSYQPPTPLHTHQEHDEMDMSPGQKRRRVYYEPPRGYPSPSPVTYINAQHFARNGVPVSAIGYRPVQAPAMSARNGTMAPPLSPLTQMPKMPYSGRSATFDETLRLPPLQTQLPQPPQSSPTSIQRQELRRESREIQAKSIEAMIRTMSYTQKIKVLARVSPPLAPPGPTSPAQTVRGAIIAVEGQELDLVDAVGSFLNEHLDNDPSCHVKTWSGMVPCQKPAPSTTSPVADVEMTSPTTLSTPAPPSGNTTPNPFMEYLGTISKWHRKSQDIIKFITTTATPSPAAATTPKSKSSTKILPIALLPRGFSLTVSDRYAVQIPINDSYSPIDHWQWMATLWRGIVGPDLTIYVKKVDKGELEVKGGVEMRLEPDMKAIIVRVLEGERMEEKTARRLGFEVGEFVRSMEGSSVRE